MGYTPRRERNSGHAGSVPVDGRFWDSTAPPGFPARARPPWIAQYANNVPTGFPARARPPSKRFRGPGRECGNCRRAPTCFPSVRARRLVFVRCQQCQRANMSVSKGFRCQQVVPTVPTLVLAFFVVGGVGRVCWQREPLESLVLACWTCWHGVSVYRG